jgi:regulator of sigma E protease
MFTAFISLNLAVLNAMPFPALDGGRVLFILIEAIIRRPLPRSWQNYANAAGFLLLMGLILILTVRDIGRLF